MTAVPADWLLTSTERGNSATCLDSRHSEGIAWSPGNEVRPLIHGATYFAELLVEVAALRSGDLLLFTDWRGDPDELLAGPGSEVASVLSAAARRGMPAGHAGTARRVTSSEVRRPAPSGPSGTGCGVRRWATSRLSSGNGERPGPPQPQSDPTVAGHRAARGHARRPVAAAVAGSAAAATRSPRTGSAASPAATSRCCTGPGR
jgi:hypothetical protein